MPLGKVPLGNIKIKRPWWEGKCPSESPDFQYGPVHSQEGLRLPGHQPGEPHLSH